MAQPNLEPSVRARDHETAHGPEELLVEGHEWHRVTERRHANRAVDENRRVDDHGASRSRTRRSIVRRRRSSTNVTGSAASGRVAQSPKAGCGCDLGRAVPVRAGLVRRCRRITSASPGSTSTGTGSVTRRLGGTRTLKRVATRSSLGPCGGDRDRTCARRSLHAAHESRGRPSVQRGERNGSFGCSGHAPPRFATGSKRRQS